jgi:hypothetical protein
LLKFVDVGVDVDTYDRTASLVEAEYLSKPPKKSFIMLSAMEECLESLEC